MNHKILKKIAMSIAVMGLAAGLSACGLEPISESVPTTTGTTSVTSAAESTSDTENTEAEQPETELTSESAEGTTVSGDTSEIPEVSDSHKILVTAAEDVIASREHTAMMEVTDATILKEFFLIDIEDPAVKDVVVYQCPMSAVMSEIIIIETDDTDAAKTLLEDRKKKAIEQDAFYPDDVDNANAAVIESCGNFVYFIMNDDANADSEVLTGLLETISTSNTSESE